MCLSVMQKLSITVLIVFNRVSSVCVMLDCCGRIVSYYSFTLLSCAPSLFRWPHEALHPFVCLSVCLSVYHGGSPTAVRPSDPALCGSCPL